MSQRLAIAAAILVGALFSGFAVFMVSSREPTNAQTVGTNAQASQATSPEIARLEVRPLPGAGARHPDEPEATPSMWSIVDDDQEAAMSRGLHDYRAWERLKYVMRSPDDFPDLPTPVRNALQQIGCRIPQWPPGTLSHNLVWGRFEKPGQRDLAVLCAKDSAATLYVFWAGDVERLEALPFGRAGRDMRLGAPADIEGHAAPNARIDEGTPPSVDHDAIEVAAGECCSTYYYRYNGRWFTAAGAD